jgi:thiol-disulfide isomerase/thioredoxin
MFMSRMKFWRVRAVAWAVCAGGVVAVTSPAWAADARPANRGAQLLQEIDQVVEALPHYPLRVQLNPLYRKQMAREIAPGLRRALELLGQLEAADRTRGAARRGERMLFLARLALWGEADAKKSLTDLSNSGVAADAVLGKAGLLMCRWYESGEAEAQRGIITEFAALAKANPTDDNLLHAALEMARYRAASMEVGNALRDVVERDLTSAAAERYKHQAYKVGRPFKVSVGTINGKSVSTTAWRGKVVLIDFWATWCPPCRDALPKLVKLYEDNHDKGLEILGISNDSSLPELRKFLAEHKEMVWPESFGPSGSSGWHSLSPQMGVNSIPTAFLIDRNGVLRYIDRSGLEEMVKELIDEPATAVVAATAAETSAPKADVAAKADAPAAGAAADPNEKQAESLLSLANSYVVAKRPDKAVEKLEQLVAKYPNSAAAGKARALLSELRQKV